MQNEPAANRRRTFVSPVNSEVPSSIGPIHPGGVKSESVSGKMLFPASTRDGIRYWPWIASCAVALVLGLSPLAVFSQPKSDLAQPPPLDRAEGEKEARSLVARLLEQRPERPVTNTGVLKVRDAESNQREVPARFDIVPRQTNWLSVYETAARSNAPSAKLTIVHAPGQANDYFLEENGTPKKLGPAEVMRPFAGSDFWVADLGLDFLHWPEQRVLRKQMRKGLFCDVLQSVNPNPATGGYSRVVSWIAVNRPEDIIVVHAEAFDARDKLLKEFDPKKVEKVDGVWQLEEMEIRNRQAGTRTRIEFNL
jgi:hypothetical protein